MVADWEGRLVQAANAPDECSVVQEVCRGYFLWLVHSRSRFGDSARVKVEPVLDLAGGAGFIESHAKAGEYKTGHSRKRIGRRYPLVGWADGLSGKLWASAWLRLRVLAGCSAEIDQTLMPEVLTGGEFGVARMKTSDGNLILRELLTQSGVPNVQNYGTHSAKATLLSWAAKAGLNRADRKMLGGHSASKDKTMEEYSRDVLAKPLKALGELLVSIRVGDFIPDATRSGRWARPGRRALAPGGAPAMGDGFDETEARPSPTE